MTMDISHNEDESWYPTLIDWIRQGGGHVHESLLLSSNNGVRGISCKSPISKGELLIRLPPTLVLSGESMPSTYKVGSSNETRHASPWLKCLGALHQAMNQTNSFFRPYLKSLPSDYEHLLQWKMNEVGKHLKGTTLGQAVQEERSQRTLQARYEECVKPYLEQNGSLQSSLTEGKQQGSFRKCCMCISTRGFHLQPTTSSDDDAAKRSCYSGPFLLPFIDLLNHNPRHSCTTLQRNDESGDFVMICERNLERGEEIFHSYGNDLSSAQVLQTFGFVPNEAIQRAASWDCENINAVPALDSLAPTMTAAIFTRDDVIDACTQMAQSNYPVALKASFDKHSDDSEQETWIPVVNKNREFESVVNSDTYSIQYSEEPLSSELITTCVLFLLPDATFDEFMTDSPALLDESVLQDYFLGKVVCQSLLLLIDKKLKTYGDSLDSLVKKLRLLHYKSAKSTGELRTMYGRTICVEEMACLEKLRAQVLTLMTSIDDDDDSHDQDNEGKGTGNKRKRDTDGV